MKKRYSSILCLTALILSMIGCGVSERKIAEAEKRLQALQEKGVPDSSLSRAKVFLYQSRNEKERGNFGQSRRSMDSLLVFLAQAEDQYEEQATPRKQRIDSMKTLIAQAREELSGKNLVKLDSVTAKSDSFLSLGWYIQAEEYAREAAEKIESLKIDEERGNLLRPKIVGTWVCTQVTKHQYDKSVNAVEKKVFQFNSDGSAKFIESKNGKSGKYFKEDWKFVSWGDFGLMGDTIYMAVDRFKAEKQNFTVGKVQEGGKVVWEKQNQPTYDSTITDGSQDRYILYSDLVQDFKKAG